MISLNEAIQQITNVCKTPATQIITVESAHGFIAAEDIYARYQMPRFNNSAMDGYAVLLQNSGQKVKVIDKVLAGNSTIGQIYDGESIKVMTGAMVPSSANCIVPQENVVSIDSDTILLPENLEAYANIRFAGEDIALNELIIQKGEEINFASITLLASQGITHIEVYKKLSVAVFASGEELKPHWEKIDEFQIYNSNTPTIIARCAELGCEPFFVSNAHDNLDSIKESIIKSLNADLIITSGGVSVGEADFTKEAFAELGFETIFSKVAIKPGKPVTFGKIGNTYILNLPGNPLASSLVFEVLGKLLIMRLSGRNNIFTTAIKAKIKGKITNSKVHQIVPGYFDGEYFIPAKKRSPGMINILSKCNSIIIINDSCDILENDSSVKVILFESKFLSTTKREIYSC